MPTAESDPTTLLQACRVGRRGGVPVRWLIRDISLTISPGERVALVGPTGSGKTVLLRALAMLDRLDAGRICWQGKPISGAQVPAFRSRVMYLHQRPALQRGTVRQNLMQPFQLAVHRDKSYDQRRVTELLQTVGRTEGFLEQPSETLSGGERQIVALLRAMQLQPQVLLLDEPTAALDAAAAAAVERLVCRWQAALAPQRAFVWVSHDAAQVERLDTRILQVNQGHLAEKA